MKSDFHEKREARKERYEQLSIKNEKESQSRHQAARDIGSHIPFGQPILVGHHSEKRHRKDLERIDNNMRKSIEADKKSEYYADKAKTIESDKTIYSDDPEAVAKLKEKIASLERNQKVMKDVNRILKSKKLHNQQKIEKMQEVGLNEKQAIQMLEPDRYGRLGFPSYSLQNNNANINRNKKRLKELEYLTSMETTEINFDFAGYEVKWVNNIEDNRLQLFFPGKPEDSIRSTLKRNGFRWSPRVGAWQRHISNAATYGANQVMLACKNIHF